MTGIEIRPGQVFQATIVGIKKDVSIPEVLLNGGALVGRLVIPPQIGGNLDTKV